MAYLLRAEVEYFLALLSERLDIAKARALLSVSLNCALLLRRDALYLHYEGAGRQFLMRSLGQVDRHGLGRQSAFIKNAQKAMVVDDVNLAHVFSLLRVEELLENLTDALPIKLCARTVLAMLGEFSLVLRDMSASNPNQDEGLAEFKRKTALFLSSTLKLFFDLILESGRDRFSYLKEAVLLPTSTCARPVLLSGQSAQDEETLLKWTEGLKSVSGVQALLEEDMAGAASPPLELHTTSLYSLYRRGDPVFEAFLHGGSLLSLWQRVHSLSASSNRAAAANESVKWSVIRQAPRLNRLRQLIFTRLVHCLSIPRLDAETDVLRSCGSDGQFKNFFEGEASLAATLLSSLVASGVRVWCYESARQKSQVLSCPKLNSLDRDRLEKILCIQVDRSFVDLPLSQELPDLDCLTRLFAVSNGDTLYAPMNVADQDCMRQIPSSAERPSRSPLWGEGTVGNGLHAAQPNFGVYEERRFFTSPLVTCLFDAEKLTQTIDSFFAFDAHDRV